MRNAFLLPIEDPDLSESIPVIGVVTNEMNAPSKYHESFDFHEIK